MTGPLRTRGRRPRPLTAAMGMLLLLTAASHGQSAVETPRALPDSDAGRLAGGFLEALASGDAAAVVRLAGSSAGHWSRLMNTVGPLELHSELDLRRFGMSGRPGVVGVWCRGVVTRAWVGFIVETGRGGLLRRPRIVAVSTVRGVAPDPGDGRPPVRSDEELLGDLSAYAEAYGASGLFSGVILLSRGAETLFTYAAGRAEGGERPLLAADTPMPVASMTKMFTSVAVAQLVSEGRLAYDDPIGRFVPEYPEAIGSSVTIGRLLDHTSGIEFDKFVDFLEARRDVSDHEGELEAQLEHMDLLWAGGAYVPPDRMDYTNEGFHLAGLIVERIAGRPFHEHLAESVFARAGMSSARPLLRGPWDESVALGSTHSPDPDDYGLVVPEPASNAAWLRATRFGGAAGGYAASAEDMLRFARALLEHRLVDAESTAELLNPRVLDHGDKWYGYGFDLRVAEDGSVVSFGHGGGMPGVSTRLDVYPDRDLVLVVLCNRDAGADHVADFVRELVAP